MSYSDMNIDELKNEKKGLEAELAKQRQEMTRIENRIIFYLNKIEKINETIDNMTLSEDNIEELLNCFPETKIRRKLQDKLLSDDCLFRDGYCIDTRQICICISLNRHSSERTIKVYNGLLNILKYLKPLKTGVVYLSVMDKDLSATGIYSLQIKDNKYTIVKTVYGRDYTEFSDPNLMRTLKYIQDNICGD